MELKQHMLLLEHGLHIVMSPEQQTSFLNMNSLLFSTPQQECPSLSIPTQEEHQETTNTQSTPIQKGVRTTHQDTLSKYQEAAGTSHQVKQVQEKSEIIEEEAPFQLISRMSGSSHMEF